MAGKRQSVDDDHEDSDEVEPGDGDLLAAVLDQTDVDAGSEEAAAIAAALGAHIGDQARAAAATAGDDTDEPGWAGRRWSYSGRMARTHGRHVQIREGAPDDPWAAAGRTDRM